MKGDQAPIARTVYVVATLLQLMFAIYQCHRMGVMPIYPSDWLAFVQPQQVRAYQYLPFICIRQARWVSSLFL